MGKWVLDRFELLYFDLKHRRWRLFQENLLDLDDETVKAQSGSNIPEGKEQDGPANYRHNIQHFLHSIRQAFDSIPKGTGITVHKPAVNPSVA